MPIQAMETTAAIPSISQSRDAKVMIQADQFQCLPSNPMQERMDTLTKNRFEAASSATTNDLIETTRRPYPHQTPQTCHSRGVKVSETFRSTQLCHEFPRPETPKTSRR